MAAYEFQLVWQDAPGGAMRVYTLEGEDLRIGRSSRCDLVVIHPEVSRFHARLFWQGDGYWIEDLSSTNGTWVNGRRLPPHEPVALHPGDTVGLGPNVLLRYQVLEAGVEATQMAEMPAPEEPEPGPTAGEESPDEDDEAIWGPPPWLAEVEAQAPEDASAATPDEAPPSSEVSEAAASAEDAPAEQELPPWMQEHDEAVVDLEEVEPPGAERTVAKNTPEAPLEAKPHTGRNADARAAAETPTSAGHSPWRYGLLGCALGALTVGCAVTGFLLWVDANALWCEFFGWVPVLACP